MVIARAAMLMRKIAVLTIVLTLFSVPVSAEGEKMFYPAGSSEITIVGEPVHVGDQLTASILVNNRGSDPGSVRLVLSDRSGSNLSVGEDVLINPGSSREVSTPFTPVSAGALELSWHVSSEDGGVSSELNGSFDVQVHEPQTLGLSFDSVQWTLSDGLDCQISVSLTEGRSRAANVSVSLISQGESKEVQRFAITLDPGLRQLSIGLEQPEAEHVSLTLETNGWTPSNSAANLTWQTSLTPPSIDPSVAIGAHEPEMPESGGFVSLPYWLNNSGTSATLQGTLRVVSTSDGMVLAQISTPAVPAEGSSSGTLSLGPWPESPMVQTEVVWSMSSSETSIPLTVFTQSEGGGGWELPFDAMAAAYGALMGLAVVLIGLVVMRAVSERTPSTESDSRALRESRITRRMEQAPSKREVKCPSCEQRLSIPSAHTGSVRCPACTTQFSVTEVKEGGEPNPEQDDEETTTPETTSADEPVARSNEEILSCPQCEQRLKIPLERRPVRSRCPACRTEFMAEVGESNE